MSGTKFAELIGVKDQTFASWRQQRRRRVAAAALQGAAAQSAPAAAAPLRWVEALLEAPAACVSQSAAALQVHLPGGARLGVGRARAGGVGGGAFAGFGSITEGASMLSFAGSLKVFVALEACDMRKGFKGLHAAGRGTSR